MTMTTPATLARPRKLPQDLAQLRTVMAADRTLMAWVRTSLSMLGFGFTIYKFLEAAKIGPELMERRTPQHVGLFLVGMGTVSMIMGTVEYWITLKELNSLERFQLGRPSLFMAVVMAISGAALFAAIAMHVM